jgi:ABC-type transport system involved in cytochrome bd biosynthesis fused ATPase/permease subunit
VVDKGLIAESGTHEELMALKGEYYTLVMSQYEHEKLVESEKLKEYEKLEENNE